MLASGLVGVVCGSFGAAGWWPAWIVLAGWIGFLIWVAVFMPYWSIRLLRERPLSASREVES